MSNIAGFLLVKFNFDDIDWNLFFWIGFFLTAFGMLINILLFDEKYRFKKVIKQTIVQKNIERNKNELRIPESKNDDIFNLNFISAPESQRHLVIENENCRESAEFGSIEEIIKNIELQKQHLGNYQKDHQKDLKGNAITIDSAEFGSIEEKGKSFDLKKSHFDNNKKDNAYF